jgi:hypothetical protein
MKIEFVLCAILYCGALGLFSLEVHFKSGVHVKWKGLFQLISEYLEARRIRRWKAAGVRRK